MQTSHRTVGDLLDQAWENKYRRLPSSRTARALTNQLKAGLGKTRVSRLSETRLQSYIDDRTKAGAKPATVIRELRHLRAVVRKAGIPLEMPEHGLREPVRTASLSQDEARAILKHLQERSPFAADVTRLALGTACRISEILARTPKEVRRHEKGLVIYVPVPKEQEPKKLVAVNGAASAGRRLVALGGPRAFGRPGKSQRADYEHVVRALAWAARQIGREDIHVHDLRRTFACWAMEKKVDIGALAHYLGHRNIETTRRWYTYLDTGTRAAIAEGVAGDL
jgi:integrase